MKISITNVSQTLFTFLTGSILLLLIRCTPVVHPHELADGDISIVDNKVAGVIYETCGEPASQAIVVLRPEDYLSEMKTLAKKTDDDVSAVCSTFTDANGFFTFDLPDDFSSGTYSVEAVSEDGKRFLFINSVPLDSQLLYGESYCFIDTPDYSPILQTPAIITGTIVSTGSVAQESTVRVYGLDRSTTINKDGSFTLDNIPVGEVRLYVTFSKTGNQMGNTIEVKTESGKTTSLDTLYQLSYLSFEGDTVPATPQLFRSGESITAPEPPKNKGYEFISWATSDDGSTDIYAPGDTLILSESTRILYPQWNRIYYRLQLSTSGKGSASVPDSVGHGIPTMIIANPEEGEEFLKWKVLVGSVSFADSTTAITEITLTSGDAFVQAVFTPITFYKTYPYINACIRHTTDGGYVFVAHSRESGSGSASPVHLVKMDQLGDIVWRVNISALNNPPNSGSTYICDLLETGDGHYLTLMSELYQYCLIKSTPTGTVLWKKNFNEEKNGYWLSQTGELLQTDDNGCIIASARHSVQEGIQVDKETVFLKLSTDGEKEWIHYYDIPSIESAYYGIDGSFFILGRRENADSAFILLPMIMKTDRDGKPLWESALPGSLNFPPYLLNPTDDGGCIYLGTLHNQIHFMSFSASGDTVSMRTEPLIPLNAPFVRTISRRTDDGGVIFASAGGPNPYLFKTTPEFTPLWTKDVAVLDDYSDYEISFIQETADEGFIFAGCISGSSFNLLKTDKNGDVFWGGQPEPATIYSVR